MAEELTLVATCAEGYRHFQPHDPNRKAETVTCLSKDKRPGKGRAWFLSYDPALDIFTEDIGNNRVAAFKGPLIDRKGKA